MANIQIHNGASNILEISYIPDTRMFHFILKDNPVNKETISVKDLEILEIATDENVKSMDPSWDLNSAKKEIPTITPGALFGFVGLTVETLYKGYPLTFIAQFKGGIKILATVKSKLYEKIKNDMK